MGTKRLKTEVRKVQIAKAALSLVSSHGLDGLSVARVARSLGVVPSALYRHFQNKDQMLDAVLDLIRERITRNIDAAEKESSNPLDQLHDLLSRQIAMIREIHGVPRLMSAEGVFSKQAARRLKARSMLKGTLGRITEIVREGQSCGRIRPDVDASTIATMFWGLLLPSAILWSVSEGEFDVTRHAEESWRVFSEAIQVG